MSIGWIAAALAPLIAGYIWYIALMGRRNKAQEALSGIDVQLKKRADLLPNILAIAKRYMQHEADLLTQVTELRAGATKEYSSKDPAAIREHLAAAERFSGQMGKLMVAVENYPELKADQTMQQAQLSYNETEAQIAAARRFYNASVTALNNAAQIFPGSLIARIAGVQTLPFYEAEAAVHAPVNAAELL